MGHRDEDLPRCRSVLVVDDDDRSRSTLARLLRLEGFDVRSAASADEATRAAAEGRVDLLVCDMDLPDRSGLELMRELRAGDGGPDLLGVAVTGHGAAYEEPAAQAAGFARHFRKPFAYTELIRAIREVCGDPAGEPAARTGT